MPTIKDYSDFYFSRRSFELPSRTHQCIRYLAVYIRRINKPEFQTTSTHVQSSARQHYSSYIVELLQLAFLLQQHAAESNVHLSVMIIAGSLRISIFNYASLSYKQLHNSNTPATAFYLSRFAGRPLFIGK